MVGQEGIRRWRGLTVAVAVLGALALQAGSAQAAMRTYVNASTGVDNLGCSLRLPCSTIQAAINATDPDGTVVITDSGTYAGVTITKSLSIIATGAHRPEIRDVSPVKIEDNYPAVPDDVRLRGLGVVSTVVTRCTDGCVQVSGPAIDWQVGGLELSDVSVRSPLGNAVLVDPGFAGGVGDLHIADSKLSNSGGGIFMGAPAVASVEHTTFRRDSFGIFSQGGGSKLAVDSSSFVHVAGAAVWVYSGLGVITHSRFTGNGYGVYVSPGTGGGAYLGSSNLIGNNFAWVGNVVSFGDNAILGNAHGDAAPPRVSYGR